MFKATANPNKNAGLAGGSGKGGLVMRIATIGALRERSDRSVAPTTTRERFVIDLASLRSGAP
jgi:hypothetical protein